MELGIQLLRVERFVAHNVTFRGQKSGLELIETTAEIINCSFLSFRNAIIATHSHINISQCMFEKNGPTVDEISASYYYRDGAIRAVQRSIISINDSAFISNRAVVYSNDCSITLEHSEFFNNNASSGNVLNSESSNITLERSIFQDDRGIELYSESSNIIIKSSKFYKNDAGVLQCSSGNITIENSKFTNNTGFIIASFFGKLVITMSEFDNNTAGIIPRLILTLIYTTCITNNCSFTNNNVGVIAALNSRIEYYNSLLIANNSSPIKNIYPIIHLDNTEFIGHSSGRATISNNLRSFVAYNSNITFMGAVKISNNKQSQTITVGNMQEGGALTLVQSNIYIDGTCKFEYNHGENGGAILSIENKLYVNGNVTVVHNTARNGGGAYLRDSELNCQDRSTLLFLNNSATHKGGGVHAISSFIKTVSDPPMQWPVDTAPSLFFTNNIAEKGGGLSLEANAKLYIDKFLILVGGISFGYRYGTVFLANSASYGGAIYVDDDSYSGTCTTDPKTECFFQVRLYIIGVYNFISYLQGDPYNIQRDLKTQSLNFSENSADISGSNLYGGLLDRCAVSQFAEVRIKYTQDYEEGGNGIMYFKHVSTITESDTSVSSQPVKVCLCTDNEQNCTYKRHIEAKKGETFNVSLASIDQINQPVSGLIHASLNLARSAVATGQATREIPAKCTNLTFNVFSPHSFEQLTLYALDGPCRDANLSKISLDINFLPCSCPIGLQIVEINHETNCVCECHRNISLYVKECNSNTGAFLKSQSKAWISFINSTELSGYLLYSNCPFDYCNTLNISIDLNQQYGADAQCAFNRSSLLCGSCQRGLSLSLGSSYCLSCPSYWPALLIAITIAAILVGIALVAVLLIFNMTVAVGTLNGLLFYANIVHANKSTLLPFQESSLDTVFISMLNLELGMDTCYFPGMDTYIKTWLKLAFPTFVFLLVGLVIIISSCSIRFSKLIGNKDPVATLATLILLSYAKIIEICFESLSVGILRYPDGSSEMVWLPDATIQYLHGKHIPLFIAAVVILLVGLVYTLLLFSWQWYFYLPQWKIIKVCLSEQRLKLFIETYHAPCTLKHRYWTGLLLITRAILYIVATANVSNDPQISLSAIVFTMIFILFLVAFIDIRMYKRIPLSVLDTFFTFCSQYSPGTRSVAQTSTRKQLPTLQFFLHSLYFGSSSSTMCTYTPKFLQSLRVK